MSEFDPEQSKQPSRSPLLAKTILVTRPRAQSEEITARLESLGATVLHLPTIEVLPPTSWESLDASIERIADYDWIIFTSVNGVQFFFRRLNETSPDSLREISQRIVCAIGSTTALAIEAAGAVATVVASDSKAEGALRAIIAYVGGEQNVRGLRFLIPRARVAREALPEGLRQLGAHVDAVETYRTAKPDLRSEDILRLFKENSIDAITFTSSSTVSNFAELAGMTDLSDVLATTLVACIGPITAETAASFGLKRIIQPQVYNATELVEAIVNSIGLQ